MKEYLVELVRRANNPLQGRNIAREYLQARILELFQRVGAMIPLAFQGGTALRFLYAHSRYSEDLDFTLERDQDLYSFRDYLRKISSLLSPEGYEIDMKISDRKTVHSAFIRFPGLLYDLGLSPQRSEVLAVKIKVDTQPPQGAVLETTVIRKHVVLQIQHYDRASLLAGKLHAILQRPFLKGRDLYDLLWYLSDPNWPAPNIILLNNALHQTNWTDETLSGETWKQEIWEKLSTADLDKAISDVRPFLEPGFDFSLLSLDNFRNLLANQ